VTVTYERRRSERLKHKMDGVRVDSVERASHRKATSAGESDSSVGSASTRRYKTRRLPDIDINKLAPMPVTASPPETSMDRLQELAACCGYMTIEVVEEALNKHRKGKEAVGTSKLNE
jgi:IMP dehydrogenase/GMP reductase